MTRVFASWRSMWRCLLAASLVAMPAIGHSESTYDPSTRSLKIPILVISGLVFTNVTVEITGVVAYHGGAVTATFDTFDLQTRQLSASSVRIGSNPVTFNNVVLTIGALLAPPPMHVPILTSAPVFVPTSPLGTATVGQAFSQSLVGSVYPASRYTYMIDTLANGSLPTGMTIDLNGLLSGTPFATGRADVFGNQVAHTYTFGVCAVDTLSRWTTAPCPTATITVIPAPFRLTTTAIGQGTITSSPAGPDHPAGTVVTVTATPASGYAFSQWSGDCTGTTCSVTMNGNKSVSASFAALPACTYTYTDWSTCIGGQQTRSVVSTSPSVCTGSPVLTQGCTSTISTACYYCQFDVSCTVFGFGGCWRCRTSSVVAGVCQAPSDALVYYGSSCRADPSLFQVCQ